MPVALCATHEGRIIAMLRVDKPSNLGAWITASTKPFRLCFFSACPSSGEFGNLLCSSAPPKVPAGRIYRSCSGSPSTPEGFALARRWPLRPMGEASRPCRRRAAAVRGQGSIVMTCAHVPAISEEQTLAHFPVEALTGEITFNFSVPTRILQFIDARGCQHQRRFSASFM